MIEDEHEAKKRVRIYEEDNSTITSYKTNGYVSGIKDEDSYNESMDIGHSTSESARGYQKPSTRINVAIIVLVRVSNRYSESNSTESPCI